MEYAGMILQALGDIQQTAQANTDARYVRAQARVAQNQSYADADAISREYRQIAGRQAAAIAQSGGGYEGSNERVLHQSETLAFLDRLNTIYHGTLRGLGLESEASAIARRGQYAAAAGLASIGSELYSNYRMRQTPYTPRSSITPSMGLGTAAADYTNPGYYA